MYQNRGITNKSQNIWLIPDSVNCSVNVLTFEWNRWSSNWRFYCSSFMCERLNQMDKYWKRLTVCSFCCILHLCITTTHICLFLPFWNLPSLLCLREEILRAIFRYLFITADDHMISHLRFYINKIPLDTWANTYSSIYIYEFTTYVKTSQLHTCFMFCIHGSLEWILFCNSKYFGNDFQSGIKPLCH